MSKISNLDSILKEAEEHAHALISCINEIRELYSSAKETVPVEQRVDCSKYVPGCFGTCDALIISDGILHICDLKYGTGIMIDAVGNDQLRIYALGALEMLSCLYDISTVRMSIFQPRLSHCDTWELSVDELLKWADEVLVPAAKQAWNGVGEFKAGEHCRFCKVRATCRKLVEYNLSLARYDFEPPATLDIIEIAAVLAKADELVSWVTDVKEYAWWPERRVRQALSGVTYDDFKVVECWGQLLPVLIASTQMRMPLLKQFSPQGSPPTNIMFLVSQQ